MGKDPVVRQRAGQSGSNLLSHDAPQATSVPRMKYGVEESPPLHIAILYGIQLVMSTIGGPLLIVYMIRSLICGSHDNLLFAELLSTSMFMMGVCTFLQTTFGVRLPVIQGSSPTFLAPIAAMMSTNQWKCPPLCSIANATMLSVSMVTTVNPGADGEAVDCDDEAWRQRLLVISGGLVAASGVHCCLGLTGAVGFLQNFIGPLTIVPAISLIGLTIVPLLSESCSRQWGIAGFTMAVYVFISLVASRFHVPFPGWVRGQGCSAIRIPIFQLFPVLVTLLLGWFVCFIFTISGVFSDDPSEPSYSARADARIDAMHNSKWLFAPYPGYWGWPTFSAAIFVGMMAAVIQSVLESMGDYYTMAGMCGLPTPPKHAVNRGIAVEGLGSLLSGFLGACHATTTYSEVVGIVAITKMSSRMVFQIAAGIYVLCGLCGKLGAAMSMCPDPVIGGISVMSMGLVTTAGLASLRHCDMTSVRNMVILGTSLMLGVMMPRYMTENPGVIRTGDNTTDQVFMIFLSSGMLVGCIIGFVLDNLIPGTPEERGLAVYLRDLNQESTQSDDEEHVPVNSVYDLPFGFTRWLHQHGPSWLNKVPFLPSYLGGPTDCRSCCGRRSGGSDGDKDSKQNVVV